MLVLKFKYSSIQIITFVMCVLFTSIADGKEQDYSRFTQNIWKGISEISDKAIDLAVNENRKDKTVFEFITLREPRYIRLLKDAQNILGTSEAEKQFDKIESLRNENRKINDKITELRKKRTVAVTSSINPLKDTKGSIDKKIAGLQEDIAENDNKIDVLKNEILQLFHANNINISYDELSYFLIAPEGNEILRLMNVAENMKRIQSIIESELHNDSANVDLSKYYTGIYLVVLDSYSSAHDTAIRNIGNYKDSLHNILNEAYRNYSDAKKLKINIADEEMSTIDSNIRLNERTIEIGKVYDSLLDRRLDNLRFSQDKINKKLKIARNTYKTIVNGSTLIKIVNDGSNDYALLMNFEMPELKNLYDGALMGAFAEISEQIKTDLSKK